MSFGAYSHNGSGGAGVNESPYLNFNVDFDGTNTWQKRIAYVPSVNGSVAQDTWNNNDAIQGGAAKWVYSGATWPGTGISGTTARTWSDLLTSYPNIRTRTTDSWLGVRVGEPGPTGYIGNVDFFSVTIGGVTKTFDFGN